MVFGTVVKANAKTLNSGVFKEKKCFVPFLRTLRGFWCLQSHKGSRKKCLLKVCSVNVVQLQRDCRDVGCFLIRTSRRSKYYSNI